MQDLSMQCHFLIHPNQLMHSKSRTHKAVFFSKLLLAWEHNYSQPLWEKEKPSWHFLYLDSQTWIFSNLGHRSFWDKKIFQFTSVLESFYKYDEETCWIYSLIMCVHFFFRTPQEKSNFPASSTLDGSPLLVNDFVISTSTANVAHFVTSGSELQVWTFCYEVSR